MEKKIGWILGIMILVMLPMIFFVCQENGKREQIVANSPSNFPLKQIKLKDNSETKGSFGFFLFMGGGSIEQKQVSYYYFYWEIEPGQYVFDKVPTNNARIIEDEKEHPYITIDDTIKGHIFFGDYYATNTIDEVIDYEVFGHPEVIFHVPPGSIAPLTDIDIP